MLDVLRPSNPDSFAHVCSLATSLHLLEAIRYTRCPVLAQGRVAYTPLPVILSANNCRTYVVLTHGLFRLAVT